jgi:hypothetical protein
MRADTMMNSEERAVQLVDVDGLRPSTEAKAADIEGQEFGWEKAKREWDTLGIVRDVPQLELLGAGGCLAWKVCFCPL